MIFPTIMFWVWMAAQQPQKPNFQWLDTTDHAWSQAHGKVFRTETACVDIYEDGFNGYWPCSRSHAPAEHVIEIRTKHTQFHPKCYCPDDSIQLYRFRERTCERVTREIWIDGVKWGVLRESSR